MMIHLFETVVGGEKIPYCVNLVTLLNDVGNVFVSFHSKICQEEEK